MDQKVENFDPAFYRPCVFPVLRELGYGTALSINNGLDNSPYSSPLDVSLSFFSSNGELIKTIGNIARLEVGEIAKFDSRDYLRDLPIAEDDNILGVLHMTPIELTGKSSATVEKQALSAHVYASDDFIEFRQEPKGVITGVAYQVGQQNDLRFSGTRRTLVQAPKVIVRENLDTLFALINSSTSFSYTDVAKFDYMILGPDGSSVAQGSIDVPAWSYRLISSHELLKSAGVFDSFIATGGLGMLVGSCENAGLIPISMTRNLDSGAIACDHSLPPVYYFTTWGGQKRIESHEKLVRKFFRPLVKR